MKHFFAFLFIIACTESLIAQTPYTDSLYSHEVISDLEYGQSINFAGNNNTLLLDIYKPIGDINCQRPCIVLVHGRAWM